MYQRTWSCRAAEPSQPRAHSRPWVLVEDPSPVAQVSDYSLLREAGFEVAVCSGPDGTTACPLVDGARCMLAESADAVLFGLDLEGEAGPRVLRGHLHHPGRPVVVQLPEHSEAELPEGATACTVLRLPTSVGGQTSALWKALCTSGWGAATTPVGTPQGEDRGRSASTGRLGKDGASQQTTA